MAGAPRQSAFLPTIKCSTCGNEIEISMMGEHICSGAPASEPMPPAPDFLGGAFSSIKQNVFDRFGRAPPSVDTSAANQAFIKSDQLTPASSSTGPTTISPKTPTGRSEGGLNGEGYFSPAIAEQTTPPQQRRPGGYGGFDEPDSYESDLVYQTSPKKQTSNLLQRMNTVNTRPFEMSRRAEPRGNNLFQRADRKDSADSYDSSSEERSESYSSSRSGPNPPSRAARKNGYGGFGAPEKYDEEFAPEPFSPAKRSDTFPRQTENALLPSRTPSAPAPRSNKAEQSLDVPLTANRQARPSFGMRPDTSRAPPPRNNFLKTPTQEGPTSINLADEFGVGNPYHSPSVSQSSSNSGYSEASRRSRPSQGSADTSPARSATSRRKPSKGAGFDELMSDLAQSMSEIQPIEIPSLSVPPAPIEKPASKADGRRPQPDNLRVDPAIQNGIGMPSPKPRGGFSDRRDPAIQEGRSRSSQPNSYEQRTSRETKSRGNCKFCELPITGKSVTSADGQLTGRYHKTCFVCTTCKEPFTSSSIYVLDDKPYCEHDYHRLNGSLCQSCDIGIEGRFLEDADARKFHERCFRCGDCGMVLEDGYFDVNGKAYCERDAWKRVQQTQPPSKGLPSGPSARAGGGGRQPYGLPSGNRLAPSARTQMQKRMTRMGMMGPGGMNLASNQF